MTRDRQGQRTLDIVLRVACRGLEAAAVAHLVLFIANLDYATLSYTNT